MNWLHKHSRPYLTAAFIAFSASVGAGEVTGLTAFTAGKPVKAADINANFKALKGATNDHETRVKTLEANTPVDLASLINRVTALEAKLNTQLDAEAVSAKYTVEGLSQSLSTPATIQFNTKVWDTHNAVTTGADWRFVAPMDGRYLVTFKYFSGAASGSTETYIQVNRENKDRFQTFPVLVSVYDYTATNGTTTGLLNGSTRFQTQTVTAGTTVLSLLKGNTVAVFNSQAATGSIYAGTTDSFVAITRIGN